MQSNVTAPDALPRTGDVVAGKYRIESVIGAGGMGVVMGAVDVSLGRPVAIKFLAPAKSAHGDAIARFLREAQAAAVLESEHVARVFDFGTLPNGAPFIVMEHLRGGDLAQVLASRGPMPIEEVVDTVLQACEVLGEAHVRGIVHRDLKPQNLFLTQRPDGSPCVKVLDFGISKATTGDVPSLTRTDVVMGTPLYMSPEQVRSLKNVDARSDIWALGAILFELLTGRPIFEAETASALCAMIAMDPPTPLRARRPDAPPELEALILRCLHKDPAGRFHDVAALAAALAPFASIRGRESATRTSRVVGSANSGALGGVGSAGLPAAAIGFGHGPTMDASRASTAGTAGTATAGTATAGTAYGGPAPMSPPVATPMASPNVAAIPYVMGAPGGPAVAHATQDNWQSTNPANRQVKSGGGAVLVALVGAGAGLVLLAGVSGAGWYFYSKSKAAVSDPAAVADAAEVSANAADAGAVPVAAAGPDAAVAVTASAVATATPTPTPTPTTRSKDGGASAQKDAGSSPSKDEADRTAALARAAENNCRNHDQQLHVFARDEASRKRAAEQAKTFTCNKGPQAAQCERNLCLEACGILNDQTCINMQRAMNQSSPAKF